MKIINIGSHRTGTTSLTKAIQILNIPIYDETNWYGNKLWRKRVICNNDYNSIVNVIKNSNKTFFEDSPYNFKDVYKHLDKNLDDAVFILTIREENDWYNSFLRWANMKNINITISDELKYNYGNCITECNRETIIKRYTERNNEIKDYFKNTKKLYTIHINDTSDDKWKTLYEITKKTIPNIPFPYLNRTK